eukprot:TRINITY_DN42580_c0_g1_i1.p1 TRINITY_DN42580_c0_g1~~TRINITY_DN42580_c0_g1_i1.p1  ORF type:complete len:296 (-),score=64.07 TRINITY_DN42580_c0_g1_i1:63-950(-)
MLDMQQPAAADDSFDESHIADESATFDFEAKSGTAVSFADLEEDEGDATFKPGACPSLGSTMVPGSANVSSLPETPLDATSMTTLNQLHKDDPKLAIPSVVAPACAAFSKRPEVCGKASRYPFEPREAARAEDGSDDGVRVRLHFSGRCQVLGTSVNGVYHPAGSCNGRRAFRRSIGGGGCPGLFLYHLPDKDCWGVGLRCGGAKVHAVCGPGGNPGEQFWHIWDGSAWQQHPADSATVLYRADYQSSRWDEQAEAGQACTEIKKALVGVRRQAVLEAKEQRMERIRNRTALAAS